MPSLAVITMGAAGERARDRRFLRLRRRTDAVAFGATTAARAPVSASISAYPIVFVSTACL